MSQAAVERCVGRLLTDEASRRRYREAPATAIHEMAERFGLSLTSAERTALQATTADTWDALADAIDPRLQRICRDGWRGLGTVLLAVGLSLTTTTAWGQVSAPAPGSPQTGEAAPARADADVLTLDAARAMALAQVPAIAIQRIGTARAEAAVEAAGAAWDPVVRLDARVRSHTDPLNTLFSGAPDGALGPRTTGASTTVSLTRLFTGGTTVTAHASASHERTNGWLALLTPAYMGAAGIDVRHPLARGRRIDAARHRLRLSRLDVTRSRALVEQAVVDVVARVEAAYWGLVAARQAVAIHERSVSLARAQRADVQARIDAGVAAEADLSTSDAAIAERLTAVAAARADASRAAIALQALIAGRADAVTWSASLVPADDAPPPARVVAPAETLVAAALARRPELRELDVLDERAALDDVLAADRTRPQVDLVGSYTLRGLAGTANPDARLPFASVPIVVDDDLQGGWGQSLRNALGHRFTDVSVGVQVTLPVGHRAALADRTSAALARDDISLRRRAAEIRVAEEVHQAVAALQAARERRAAATEARTAAARQLAAEEDRHALGVSTDFLLLTRQTDLARAELAEVAARADEAHAATELDRATGRLLERRGIHWEDPR